MKPWPYCWLSHFRSQRLRVTVIDNAGTELGQFDLTPEILNPTTSGEDWFKPGIAAVHDLTALVPAVQARDLIHIQVRPIPDGAQYHAMVAVTDNETETVSIITAQ